MDAIAIEVPVRAAVVVMASVKRARPFTSTW
jgi:hypothetical protein